MFRRRIYILLGAFLLTGLLLLARLAQIQVGWHGRFDREAFTRAAGSRLIETVRGGVYARWGTPLATEVPSFELGVHFSKLADGDWRAAVSRVCGIPEAELAARAEDIMRRVERMEERVRARQMEREGKADIRVAERYEYHCVAEGVAPEDAAVFRTEPERFPRVQVGRTERPAVQVLERTRRRYLSGALAPHVVGLVSRISPETWEALTSRDRAWVMGEPLSEIGRRYKMDDSTGVSGAELAYEDMLRGRRGYVLNRLVFHLLGYGRVSDETPPQPGLDVYLTIREDLQAAANEALHRAAEDEQYAELAFQKGALVILDVRDGSVLAAATYPSYDLTTFRDDYAALASDPRSPLLFRPIQGALPTGSVYKTITAVAALEEGRITPQTTFRCERREVFRAGRSARTFRCTGLHGTLPLLPAIEKSCNIYFYHTGLAAGGEALARWGRAFGLGMPTGVDLPHERSGQVLEPKHTYGVINLSIGQGDMLASPLQVANMMAVVANGGRLYTPHFFDHARSLDGEVVSRYEPRYTQVPVSEATLRVVREGLRRAVESGTARHAGLDGFRAAGKTGTAELGRDQPNHAWFAGYAPHDAPKIAFAVVSERVPGGHGGSHAAPIMALCLDGVWEALEAMP